MLPKIYTVTLLAPSGRQQPVELNIARDGLRLLTLEGKEINVFAYETIRKWLPSHLRSKNPGTEDCLDLQVETDKGPRDLRMRCDNPGTVKLLIRDLRSTTEAIMHELESQAQLQGLYQQSPMLQAPAPTAVTSPLMLAEDPYQQQYQQQQYQQQQHQQQQYQQQQYQQQQQQPEYLRQDDFGRMSASAYSVQGLPPDGAPPPPPQPADSLQTAPTLSGGMYNTRSAGVPDSSPGSVYDAGGGGGPMMMQATDGSGVAQLFIAQPTGITLPVLSDGNVHAPVLLDGLQAAAITSTLQQQQQQAAQAQQQREQALTAREQQLAVRELAAQREAQRSALAGDSDLNLTSRAASFTPGYYNVLYESGTPVAMVQPIYAQQQQQPQAPQTQVVPIVVQQPYPVPSPSTVAGPAPDAAQQRRGSGGGGRERDHDESPRARRRVEFSTARGTGASEVGESGDLVAQVRFLEDLVARLSTEVSRRHMSPERAAATAAAFAGASSAPDSPARAALPRSASPAPAQQSLPVSAAAPPPLMPAPVPGPPPIQAPDLDALLRDDALGAAALLRDQKLLQPLLAAYDQRTAQLEAELRSRTEQLQALKSQVDEVAEENDRLRAELARALEAREIALSALPGPGGARDVGQGGGGASTEELELLRQENELLVSQQSELDAEIQRLQRQLSERAQDQLRSGQDQAALAQQAQVATAKAAEAEAKASKLAAALKASEQKNAALATQAARARAAADEERAVSSSAKASLEELRTQVGQMQLELQSAQQRYKVAADGSASLQLELSTARERNDVLSGQLAQHQREGEALRSALSSVEAKLSDYQRRDAEAYARIKEASSAAEEARMSRDTALSRQADLERQLELANTRLVTVRQATREAVQDEMASAVSSAQASAAGTREELMAAQAAVAEWRARAERLERDQLSLQSELAGLREDTAAVLSSKSRLGLASLGVVERVASLERERDDAVAKLESAQRRAERVQREWQLEKQAMEHTLRGLKVQISEVEGALGASRAETATAKRQAEVAMREAAAVRAARAQAESELRHQMAAARAERDAEVKALSAKLEAAVASANTASAEAERLLSAKQEVLARWREEAQMLAGKMEGALSDHKRELMHRAAEANELRARAEALAQENVSLAGSVNELEVRIEELEDMVADAEARVGAGSAQLMAAANREAAMQQELRALQALLDRTHYEKSRMQRAHDPLAAKLDALKKDIRAAGAGFGPQVAAQRPQSPDAVVHAVRAVTPRHGGASSARG